ncbi:hypothetical protein [Chamaesiphon sp. VAR_48_metabat_403]|uniref:hypothetical protein n=1 Tax=Chamaesiphon sp. VAR_48_metabat_403 TaxID=2964700 RepID=UPI00286E1345|nr:hypothetical protein [Chamaesiphon sp. VAR_48_metabat_403]
MKNILILADVAPDAGYTRNFEYCIKVTNLTAYPERLLFIQVTTHADTATPYQLIETDRCISLSGYRAAANIAAINKSQLSDLALQNIKSTKILTEPRLQKFLIKSKSTIPLPHSVPLLNDGKQVVANVQIQSIDNKDLKFKIADENSSTLNVFLFPAIGMAILGWLAWKRDRKLAS